MESPINPYVAGVALRGEKGFFGRQDTLSQVARELRSPVNSALVLFGQRRIGKTSVLMQLQRTLPADLFVPIYFDLQDQATRPLAQVLADLADTAAEWLGLRAPSSDGFDDRGRFFRRAFLPRLYQAIGKDRRPVFLLDEFDVLDRTAVEELPETAAARALFPFLRRVMADDHRPAFVIVVGRRAEDLSLDFTATFRTSLVRELWVLDRGSAEALVRQAEVNDTLRFTTQAVVRILALTNCHPYLTQLLCQRIWERAYARDRDDAPAIDVQAVESAVADALETGGQALAWLWSGLRPAERVYVAALAEIAGEGQAVPRARVIQALASLASRLRTREVEQAPHDLVKRRVLEPVGEREHRFALELFRRWVRGRKPLDDVKDELDRVDAMAERLYGLGEYFFQQRQWEHAVRYFRDALEAYPYHFRARLHLGEALLELGQTDAAVSELERAHELDRNEAEFSLARAKAQARTPVGIQKLLIDESQERVYLGGREVRLSRLEYLILLYLGKGVGQPVAREALAHSLRVDAGYSDASVDAAIYRLRKKLGDSANNPTYLETRRGRGYVLHHATYIPESKSAS